MIAAILQRIRGTDGNPVQRLYVLALIGRGLVVDLEVVATQRLAQHVVHRRLLGRDHQIEQPSAPLAESAVEAGAATDGCTDRHRADGQHPDQCILFRREERIDFVQPEQSWRIADQSSIRKDATIVAR